LTFQAQIFAEANINFMVSSSQYQNQKFEGKIAVSPPKISDEEKENGVSVRTRRGLILTTAVFSPPTGGLTGENLCARTETPETKAYQKRRIRIVTRRGRG